MTIDPTQHYCKCGLSWTPGLHHKIIMLLKGEYNYHCPQCGTMMKFRLINHVVKTETKPIKNREEVYKNG